MKELNFDSVVIGAGAAGMAAALEIAKNNYSVALIDREGYKGGILLQCIHNGFGLHEFKKQLTGPEYADAFATQVDQTNIQTFLDTTVMQIETNEQNIKILNCLSKVYGVMQIRTKSVVLAMGCRERNRGNIGTAGDRPSGIFTAGLAQRLINVDGYIPGKDVVIVGSGDIGLIMARRLTWSGCKVHAVVELNPFPAGLTRNIVQCLNDFNIPLYLSHIVSAIHGKDRVTSVDITPLLAGKPDYSNTFTINCDTVLLSVGLVPENELSKEAHVKINPVTNGPVVDAHLQTSVNGIFACGNVLHVHDLVDFVTSESRRAGQFVVKYLQNQLSSNQIEIKAGKNIRYVCPQKVDLSSENKVFMRTLVKKSDNILTVSIVNGDNKTAIKTMKLPHVQPSEMLSVILNENDLSKVINTENSYIEVNLD